MAKAGNGTAEKKPRKPRKPVVIYVATIDEKQNPDLIINGEGEMVKFGEIDAIVDWAKKTYENKPEQTLMLLRTAGTLFVGERKQTVCRIVR